MDKILTQSEHLVPVFQYLTSCQFDTPGAKKIEQLNDNHLDYNALILFKIEEITFEEDAPRQEALENVFSALRHISGINFIYLILGDENGVNFYFGLSKDIRRGSDENIRNIGESILKSSLEGNFRGSRISEVEEREKRSIIGTLVPPSEERFYAILDGTPGVNKDDEKKNFQGVDRLVDVMLGDIFGFMVIAHPISDERDVLTIERDIYSIYDEISRFAKQSLQFGSNQSEQTGSSESMGIGSSDSEGYSDTEGTNRGSNEGINYSKGTNEGTNVSKGTNEGTNYSRGTNEGTNYSRGTNEGQNYSQGTNEGTNKGSSRGGPRSSTNNGSSYGRNESSGKSSGTNETTGRSSGTNETTGRSSGTNETIGKSSGSNETVGKSSGTSVGESRSKTHNISISNSTNHSTSTNKGEQKGLSTSITTDLTHKNLQEWMKYFDEVILPRWDYGHGKGIFITSSLLWASNEKILKKLGSTATALFAGEKGNRIPLAFRTIEKDNNYLKTLRLFQPPISKQMPDANTDEWKQKVIRSHAYLSDDTNQDDLYLGSWMSVKELAVMAGIPQKEVVGLRLKEEVEFGLNVYNSKPDDKAINLGRLVVSGNKKRIPVNIPVADLDRHIFVTGVTGAGKTTTCLNLLIDSNYSFMVIEPAKTEYRILKDKFPDLKIFTIGSNVAPLKLNPFQFFKGENITSRVDMIKASIEAAFDMEAAIPQIIEQVIYDSYEEKGWNINTNENSRFENPFAPDVYSFPTLTDVIGNVEKSVEKHGFDEKLKKDYIGSIKARLQGLVLGAKGMMLNCCHSMDFDELIDMRVVLELEELRDGGQKSLVIGFVMMNLVEAIRRRFNKNGAIKVKHITLIEEAHRLLSKPQPGDSNRRHGVEVFTDMLAEIRKYGESLIIADQIPNKLTPEVLKNTNTKIVHRLFAQDDKDAIGNTMALAEEQRNFLSNLDVGRAIVFNGNWPKAVQVQIKKGEDNNTSKEVIITSEELKTSNLDFYIERWDKGIVDYADLFGHKPSHGEMETIMQLRNNPELRDAINELKKKDKDNRLVKPLEELFAKAKNKDALFSVLAENYLKSTGDNGKSQLSEAFKCYKEGKELDADVKKSLLTV